MSALRSFQHIFKYSPGPDSVLLNWQIISEFERILGLETSVFDTYVDEEEPTPGTLQYYHIAAAITK